MTHDPVRLERLQDRIGWHPSTSVAEGVERTLKAGAL